MISFAKHLIELQRQEMQPSISDICKIMKEMAQFEAYAKIHYHEKRHRQNYIQRANKWAQIKHIQTRRNNTKNK